MHPIPRKIVEHPRGLRPVFELFAPVSGFRAHWLPNATSRMFPSSTRWTRRLILYTKCSSRSFEQVRFSATPRCLSTCMSLRVDEKTCSTRAPILAIDLLASSRTPSTERSPPSPPDACPLSAPVRRTSRSGAADRRVERYVSYPASNGGSQKFHASTQLLQTYYKRENHDRQLIDVPYDVRLSH